MSLKGLKKTLHADWREYLVVTVLFLLVTNIITDWVLLDVDSKVFATGIGDATSGFMWLMYATQGWSFFTDNTTLINYPVGENLWSPVYITWLLIMGPFWLISRAVSPIAASNIMLVFGFLVTALVAYWLLKRLTRSRAISFIGAYAIAFVPYHVAKGSDHLTNVYAWVFVAIIGAFIAFWRNPTWKRGTLLAVSVAAACYTDGYFIYVTAALLIGLFVASTLNDALWTRSLTGFAVKAGRLVVVGALCLILLIPILWVQLFAQKMIAADLANARDNPRLEVSYYATRPLDLLLPPTGNVTVSQFDWYHDLRDRKNGHSNDVESTNYIGYVVLTLYIVGLYIWISRVIKQYKSKSKPLKKQPLEIHVLGVTLIAAPFVLLWMIPPVSHIGPLSFVTPTYFMAEYLPYWRVPARAFLALHPLMVIAAMITLMFMLRNTARKWRYLVVAIVFGVVAIEYFSLLKHPSFSTEDMPKSYTWLKQQGDIDAIAEVPIVDRPIEVSGYYVFAQQIHGKSLVNSALSKRPIGLLNPLGDLDNTETINMLRSRGVDAVVVHEKVCREYDWGDLAHSEQGALPVPYADKDATTICIYRIKDTVVPDPYFINAREGFNKTDYLDKNQDYWLALKESSAEIEITDAAGNRVAQIDNARLSFTLGTLGAFAERSMKWSLSQNGNVIAEGNTISSANVEAIIDVASPIKLSVTTMQGGPFAEGEIGLLNVVASDISHE